MAGEARGGGAVTMVCTGGVEMGRAGAGGGAGVGVGGAGGATGRTRKVRDCGIVGATGTGGRRCGNMAIFCPVVIYTKAKKVKCARYPLNCANEMDG